MNGRQAGWFRFSRTAGQKPEIMDIYYAPVCGWKDPERCFSPESVNISCGGDLFREKSEEWRLVMVGGYRFPMRTGSEVWN